MKITQLLFTAPKLCAQIFCYGIFSLQLFGVKTCVLRKIKKTLQSEDTDFEVVAV